MPTGSDADPEPDRSTLFITCAHRERETAVATALVRFIRETFDLPRDTIVCTADPSSGLPTGQWGSALRERLRATRLGLVIVSPGYATSDFCKHEVGALWALEVPIIPLLLDTSASGLGDLLRPWQAIALAASTAPDSIVTAVQSHWSDLAPYPHYSSGTELLATVQATTSSPANRPVPASTLAATRNREQTDLAYLTEGRLQHLTVPRYTIGPFSSTTEPLPGTVRCTAAGTHLPDTDHRELFAALDDGRMLHRFDWADDGTWNEMSHPQPAPLRSLHAVSPAPERFSLYAVAHNGSIWRSIWPGPGSDWQPWTSLPLPVDADQPGRTSEAITLLSVTSNWPGGEDVFAVDTAGTLWVGWCTPHGAPVTWWIYDAGLADARAITAVSRMDGHLELFILDHRGKVFHRFRNPDSESNVMSPRALLEHQPEEPSIELVACSAHDGAQALFGRSESGRLWQLKLWEDRWHAPWRYVRTTS